MGRGFPVQSKTRRCRKDTDFPRARWSTDNGSTCIRVYQLRLVKVGVRAYATVTSHIRHQDLVSSPFLRSPPQTSTKRIVSQPRTALVGKWKEVACVNERGWHPSRTESGRDQETKLLRNRDVDGYGNTISSCFTDNNVH
jgi:hypothetical protein